MSFAISGCEINEFNYQTFTLHYSKEVIPPSEYALSAPLLNGITFFLFFKRGVQGDPIIYPVLY